MIPLRRTPRLRLHLAFALALVLAQSVAVAHLAGHSSDSRDEPVAPAQVCAQCATLHVLLTVVPGGPAYWTTVPVPEVEAPATVVTPVRAAAPNHAFLSRGPPASH